MTPIALMGAAMRYVGLGDYDLVWCECVPVPGSVTAPPRTAGADG